MNVDLKIALDVVLYMQIDFDRACIECRFSRRRRQGDTLFEAIAVHAAFQRLIDMLPRVANELIPDPEAA